MIGLRGFPVILLNGPPGSGKDTIGRAIVQSGMARRASFSDPLKRATHELYGLRGIEASHFESRKDLICGEFFGLTPREAYILVSEEMVKPNIGQQFFGVVILNQARDLKRSGAKAIVVTDSGFAEEAQPIIAEVGAENVLLLHVSRPGKTFAGDSRSYWNTGLQCHKIVNDGTAEAVCQYAEFLVCEWLAEIRT